MTEWRSSRVSKASLMLILPCEVIIWSSVILTDMPSSKDQKSMNIFALVWMGSMVPHQYGSYQTAIMATSLLCLLVFLLFVCQVGALLAGGWERSQFERKQRLGNLVTVYIFNFHPPFASYLHSEKWCLFFTLVVQFCYPSLVYNSSPDMFCRKVL